MKNERLLTLGLLLWTLLVTGPKLIAQDVVYVCPPCGSACDDLTFKNEGKCNHCNMTLITEEARDKTMREGRKIAFYLQDGVEILDFAGPMEVFVYAGFEIFTVSKNRDPIISQGVLKIMPDYALEEAPNADILAFFGGNSAEAFDNEKVIDWVKSRRDIELYFSVCTGAFVLAEAGILDGKTATTFHDALDGLEKNYPSVSVRRDVRFVDNGDVITTAGISAGIDGALHMVAKLKGLPDARRVAYHMEYDKWIPGEGLLLTEVDPYRGMPVVSTLIKFEGKYEFANNETVEVFVNKRQRSLWVSFSGQNHPLFFDGDNRFTQLDGASVNFQEEDGQVVGYTSSITNQFYAKMK